MATDDTPHLIDLFPLELVVLPGEVLPLHIFEERYRRLIAQRRADGQEFGIVHAEGSRVHECGCTVALSGVLEELEDGNLNIVVVGRHRFRILRLIDPGDEQTECLRAEVELYEDDETEAADEVRASAVAAFTHLLDLMGVERPQVPPGTAPLSFRLGAAIDFGADVKQALLESTSESERLADLIRVLRALAPQLQAQRKRAEAIRGNGKGS